MAITPHTDLRLLKVPINIDNQNQLTFANANAQYNYFNSLDKLEVDNFTYQRKDGIIRYPAHIDSIINFNYCMYQNSNYTNKWFYAFITGMTYINDNMTEINISTDVYQTWQFDIDIKTSYVEREHVNDDTIGVNTYPENLETGEYIINFTDDLGDKIGSDYISNNAGVVVFSTAWFPFYSWNGSSYSGTKCNNIYGGVEQGTGYLALQNTFAVEVFLREMAKQGHNEDIIGCFIVPKSLISSNDPIPSSEWTQLYNTTVTPPVTIQGGYKWVPATRTGNLNWYENATIMHHLNQQENRTLDGYTPVNKKCYCYPYNFIECNNNGGTSVVYRWEEFKVRDYDNFPVMNFEMLGVPSPGCSIKGIPLNYKYYIDAQHPYYNFNEGITLAKYPIASFATDMYTNWLTQNSLNQKLSITESLFKIGTSTLTSNPIGVVSGSFGIAETLAEKEKHKFTPTQVEGDTNNGDVIYSSGKTLITFNYKSCKQEYIRKIDNFFSMFGYRVNITKVPNVWGRTNWNYVKTIDVNIEGYIPQTDLQAIKDMFNNGVTFWHNPSTFLDYSQTNAIVS